MIGLGTYASLSLRDGLALSPRPSDAQEAAERLEATVGNRPYKKEPNSIIERLRAAKKLTMLLGCFQKLSDGNLFSYHNLYNFPRSYNASLIANLFGVQCVREFGENNPELMAEHLKQSALTRAVSSPITDVAA